MKIYKEPVKFKGIDPTIESWYDRGYHVWYAALFTSDHMCIQVFEAEFDMTQELAVRWVKDKMSEMENV